MTKCSIPKTNLTTNKGLIPTPIFPATQNTMQKNSSWRLWGCFVQDVTPPHLCPRYGLLGYENEGDSKNKY